MRKEEFLSELERSLDKISKEERTEILYDYEEHFTIGKENGKTEEQICLELGNPKEIANNYLSDHIYENTGFDSNKEETKAKNVSASGNNERKFYPAVAIVAGILICFSVGYLAISRHNNANVYSKKNATHMGEIKIDSSGIHGDGISIDSDGVNVPGASISSGGEINAPGVSIDGNGIKAPGVSIDSNGIKAPGVDIDSSGVKVNVPNVNINIKK